MAARGRRRPRGGRDRGATLAYALFGPSSRYLIVGPDTAPCLLLASAITYAETLRDAARAGGAGSDRPDSE